MRTAVRFLLCVAFSSIVLSPRAGADPAQTKPTKVCVISILTGQYSDIGQAFGNAALLAVEDYRAKHPQEQIEFLLDDDGADPKKGLSAYLRLKEVERCQITLPLSTFGIGPVRERINAQRDLTFIVGNEPYEPEDDYIYMLSPAAIPAERALGEHIAKTHPNGKILIVTSQNDALIRFARAAKEGSGARGELLELPSGTTDFRTIALTIKRKSPVAIAIMGLPLETANLLKELRLLKFKAPLYFDDSVSNSLSDMRAVMGDLSYLDGAQILTMKSETDPNFLKRYSERFNAPGKIWIDFAYDAVSLALLLKDRPVEEARQWLKTASSTGVSGTIRFDEVGLRAPRFAIIPLAEHPAFQGAVK